MLQVSWTNNELIMNRKLSLKLSLMNFRELAMNRIKTYQVHNNSAKFMKLPLIYFHELAMNRIKTYQVYNNSAKFMKLPLMNIREQAMNWTDRTKLKKTLLFINTFHNFMTFMN